VAILVIRQKQRCNAGNPFLTFTRIKAAVLLNGLVTLVSGSKDRDAARDCRINYLLVSPDLPSCYPRPIIAGIQARANPLAYCTCWR
jgi:hypothetical protein